MTMREYIINNFKEDNTSQIKEAIDSSIKSKEEDPLFGLGVLFELLWQNSDEQLKNIILEKIKKAL